MAGGARWSTSWSSPVELHTPDGRLIELRPLADAAIEGDQPARAAVVAAAAPIATGPIGPPVDMAPPAPTAPTARSDGAAAPTRGAAATAAGARPAHGLPEPPIPPFTSQVPAPYRWAGLAARPARRPDGGRHRRRGHRHG